MIHAVYIYGLPFDGKELEESSLKIFWAGKAKKHIILAHIEILDGREVLWRREKSIKCAQECSRVTDKVKASKRNLGKLLAKTKHTY